MPTNDGAAHEVQAGRLKAFEDTDEELTFTLPPRPGRNDPEPDEESALATSHPAAPAHTGVAVPPSGDPGTRGLESKVRASNVHIPVSLLEPIAALKKQKGLSNGEIIISAIEATYADLKNLIHPSATAGGSLFAARHSHVPRSSDGPLTPLNYRLRGEDYVTLDRLVDQLEASSRGHLITVALTAYFRTAT
jgi:hypothetical protein